METLDATPAQRMYDLTSYLSDWLLLKIESYNAIETHEGKPSILCNGPIVPNILMCEKGTGPTAGG